jgi:hypothetical protein
MNFIKLGLFTVAIIFGISHSAMAADKSDKTGTNPINFTNDLRVYNEYSWLNTRGDGNQNVSTLEYRTPFANGKWQFRTRIRHSSIDADINNDGIDELDSSGLGEVDFRFLTVPYLNMEKKVAVAVGWETFLPTGNSTVGSDRLSFGPQVFGVLFMPFGIKNSLIAPAYQYRFSVDTQNDVDGLSQSLFDVFFLKTSADKSKWMMINPQYVLDHDTSREFGFIDIELGMMLDPYLGTKGHSTYVRPSIGIGPDHPTDGSIEVGYKIIW